MPDNLPFVQAKYFRAANDRAIRVVVIHDMEAAETKDTAENAAHYFTNPTTVSSAHVCVDNNSAVRCVQDKDIAFHAPGCNNDGLGIEHAGFASQSRIQWLDQYSHDMLKQSAALVAGWCFKYNIPAKKLTVSELIEGQKGIVGHVDVSNAYHQSTHTDPGSFFPWDVYMPLVNAELDKLKQTGPQPAVAKAPLTDAEKAKITSLQFAVHVSADGAWGPGTDLALRTVRTGPKGSFDVKRLQTAVGAFADGQWGNLSQQSYQNTVKKIQRTLGVTDDGNWGPKTDDAFYALRSRGYMNP